MVRNFCVFAIALVIGTLIGIFADGNRYLNGRLSACKDFTSALNQNGYFPVVCVIEKDEVYITAPQFEGKLVKLNGELKD